MTEIELPRDPAIEALLLIASRMQRALSSYRRLLRLEERKLKPIVEKWLEWTARKLRAGLSDMRGKTPAARAESIANWKEIQEQGREMIKPALFEILQAGGNSAMTVRQVRKQEICFDPIMIRRTWEVTKQERFDPIGVEAVKWTEKHSAELVVEITDETMLAIREYIKTGINEGKSIQKIAMELRPLVGLTARDIKAVANYHEMLIVERPEYTAATQAEMAETYAQRLHRRRATTIARTETAFGLTEGQRQGYDQMGIERLQRIEDPDCCDVCDEHQGDIYTIEEAEGVLPEHPNCEGTWVAA